MNTRTKQLLAVLFALVLTILIVTPAVAAGTDLSDQPAVDPTLEQQTAQPAVEIDDSLYRESGETEIMLRLSDPTHAIDGDRESVIDSLQTHASQTQAPVLDRLEGIDGVTVERTWWITNAVMITADLDRIELEALARIDGVERLHENHQFEPPEPVSATEATETENVTYGLDQIAAPDAWDAFDATGDGIRVVVADTGVDDSHPDIELAAEDGWVDLVGDADEPVDNHGHGTHVSGTIAGSNESGIAIGVAPDAELANARVCQVDSCDGQAILDSFEWAVETDSDVLSMSLGGPITGQYVEPIRNSMTAGTLVVASIGNSGEGTAGSPGAVYDSIASGATSEELAVTDFSGGMLIDTEAVFGDAAPADWPEQYITPDIAAPGHDVFSANAVGGSMCGDVEYCEVSGTSMSAPHKSGAAAAIMGAASDELDPYAVQALLTETAWKPDFWDESEAQDAINGVDTRYGHGIIDVYTATAFANTNAGIEGTVTDDAGEPVEGALVTVDEQYTTVTDADGTYELTQLPGTHDVTVEAFGHESAETTVTIEDDDHVVTADFALDRVLDGAVVADQPNRIEGGETITTTLAVANLESIAVDLVGEYDAANASLSVDGTAVEFGETVTFDEPVTDELDIAVETTDGTAGELGLEHTLSGLGDETTVETGPTIILEELTRVGVLDDLGAHGDDVAEALSEALSLEYAVDVITASDAPDTYEAIVVQHLDPDEAEAFIDATSSDEVGVIYLDQWGDDSNGIPVHSEVTGEPAETFQDDFGPVPVYYELEADHAIFDGVGDAGEEVEIHTGDFADHTWFEGTTFDVLASIGDGDGLSGDAFAIDDESATILASGLGYTSWAGDGDYTEAADAILANSVQYLSDDDPAEPVATISIGSDRVFPGEVAAVDIDVGAAVAGYEAEIAFDPDVVQVESVSGVDFEDPVTSIDNDEGTLSLAQAQAHDTEAPTLAGISFEHVGEAGDETELAFDDENTAINDAEGHLPVETAAGMVGSHPCEPGDVNADGDITAFDATLTQQYIVGMEPTDDFYEECADMNGDGVITPADVTLILQTIVGAHDVSAIAG
ncbi:S8 family serine peptidase [Halovivax gelatinilyticus]|uniref:S8 family serine peptidase n=1 Tax=Halovivax gelatinilyticus TaxID=2961597 RepID=UPI0020CA5516|nr:S8 family serine peptidase [Halovivax gelatinilyticus]